MKTKDILSALQSVLYRREYQRDVLGLFKQGAETWRKGDKVVGIPHPLTISGAEEVAATLAAAEGMPVSAVIDELEDAARRQAADCPYYEGQ